MTSVVIKTPERLVLAPLKDITGPVLDHLLFSRYTQVIDQLFLVWSEQLSGTSSRPWRWL